MRARELEAQLAEIQELVDERDFAEADSLLRPLAEASLRNRSVLAMQVNLTAQMQDIVGYERAALRLLQVEPQDTALRRALGQAHMLNMRPALAKATLAGLLQRYPDDPEADAIREELDRIEGILEEERRRMSLPPQYAHELLLLHDQIRMVADHGELTAIAPLVKRALRLDPTFIPILNNSSLAYYLTGQLDQAIADAERVLEMDPDNVHALGNLVRCYVLLDNDEKVRELLERLHSVEEPSPDYWVKRIETLSYLRDDQAVADTFRKGREAVDDLAPREKALFLHYGAVALHRLGQVSEAIAAWEEALGASPHMDLVADNLADLQLPLGERSGAWPMPLTLWIPRAMVETLMDLTGGSAPSTNLDVERTIQRFVKQNPWVGGVLEALFERGDPQGRQFAVLVVRLSGLPAFHDLLEAFVHSPYGPDSLRHEAAQFLRSKGYFPDRMVSIWSHGEQTDLELFGFEVTSEVVELYKYAPRNTKRMREGVMAARQGNYQRAVALYEQVIAEEKDAPDAMHNLAVAYHQLGRMEESKQLRDRVVTDYPDYFFGQCTHAVTLIQQGDVESAQEIAMKLLRRDKYHISEFAAMCKLQCELGRAKEDPAQLEYWLNLWKDVYPNHPDIPSYQQVLSYHKAQQQLGSLEPNSILDLARKRPPPH